MIEPQELRIGNLVLHQNQEIQIDNISDDSINVCWNGMEQIEREISVADIYPILLTDEILLRCGFMKTPGLLYEFDYLSFQSNKPFREPPKYFYRGEFSLNKIYEGSERELSVVRNNGVYYAAKENTGQFVGVDVNCISYWGCIAHEDNKMPPLGAGLFYRSKELLIIRNNSAIHDILFTIACNSVHQLQNAIYTLFRKDLQIG